MSEIRCLVMDVDGTLTDGKIYMSAEGELFKAFDIKDGCGIHDLLPKAGIIPVVITARLPGLPGQGGKARRACGAVRPAGR